MLSDQNLPAAAILDFIKVRLLRRGWTDSNQFGMLMPQCRHPNVVSVAKVLFLKTDADAAILDLENSYNFIVGRLFCCNLLLQCNMIHKNGRAGLLEFQTVASWINRFCLNLSGSCNLYDHIATVTVYPTSKMVVPTF